MEANAFVNMIKMWSSDIEATQGIDHVCLPLLGRFKSEIREDKHVDVVANVSESGIRFK